MKCLQAEIQFAHKDGVCLELSSVWIESRMVDCASLVLIWTFGTKRTNHRIFFLFSIGPRLVKPLWFNCPNLNMKCPDSLYFYNYELMLHLKGLGSFCRAQCPQIYIKLTQFENNGDRKFPLNYYMIKCCSFWELSKTSHKNNIRL